MSQQLDSRALRRLADVLDALTKVGHSADVEIDTYGGSHLDVDCVALRLARVSNPDAQRTHDGGYAVPKHLYVVDLFQL